MLNIFLPNLNVLLCGFWLYIELKFDITLVSQSFAVLVSGTQGMLVYIYFLTHEVPISEAFVNLQSLVDKRMEFFVFIVIVSSNGTVLQKYFYPDRRMYAIIRESTDLSRMRCISWQIASKNTSCGYYGHDSDVFSIISDSDLL